MIKCGCERAVEVPIHFEHRRFGDSKLTVKQQLLYLEHLRRLYTFKCAARVRNLLNKKGGAPVQR